MTVVTWLLVCHPRCSNGRGIVYGPSRYAGPSSLAAAPAEPSLGMTPPMPAAPQFLGMALHIHCFLGGRPTPAGLSARSSFSPDIRAIVDGSSYAGSSGARISGDGSFGALVSGGGSSAVCISEGGSSAAHISGYGSSTARVSGGGSSAAHVSGGGFSAARVSGGGSSAARVSGVWGAAPSLHASQAAAPSVHSSLGI
ncbi:keratin, type II cytoskeletal 2 epidermal-like [Penaeus japonicus]|uniref:keratin, type II cytoskeletal 2 epidermal-like n=1 Tax=Penaeus japonicus TaxID=27405 RepID=UPI001C70D0EB|nr:keratin, type II cytoskeletal 2 epidermal-like [Penaeus japonicus]